MGLFVALVATVALVFVDCSNPYAGLALLTIGVGSIGCTTGAGYIISINEVGGIYSGVLFGISNTFGTIPGIVAPYIVSVLTSNVIT
jgi:ACS family sodium-dependent inorganic phosphate cotransporter-like MFS transporter 5